MDQTSPLLPEDGNLHAMLREILVQLRQLNENILLTDDQRRLKAQATRDRISRQLVELSQAAMETGNFDHARELIDTLANKIPDDENIAPLRARLADSHVATREADLAATASRVSDLMAVGLFDQAESAALELCSRYPDLPEAAEMLDRARREGRMLQDERRDRMYNEVARLAETRRWRDALQAAHRFIQAFPDGTGAGAVRTMLATIEDNARIEEVRELRDNILDLIERRRYGEALEHARDVIERFPDTRAAEELGRQIGRLTELARQ